jgi:formate hydrogenlyase subunit 3/multisubunit Na+/H+ antiporter MnhD subunit
VLLIIFHAIAKGLLFLCVGLVEHKIDSRNIDDMAGMSFDASGSPSCFKSAWRHVPCAVRHASQQIRGFRAVLDSMPLMAVFVVFGTPQRSFPGSSGWAFS